MSDVPTTPAEAVAQWCEANGWAKNPEFIPAGTRFVRILDGEVRFDGVLMIDRGRAEMPKHRVIYADLPVLPTEIGSLIVDVTTKAGTRFGYMYFDGARWVGVSDAEGWRYVIPDSIASWHPGKAVRADA